jgi:hypothetical protein
VRRIAVFDTNTPFSEVGWDGDPLLWLELARAVMIDGVTCHELFAAFHDD